jgi:DnaA-homolog protein
MQQLTLDLAPPPPPTLENFVPGANAQVLAALRALLADAGGERRLCLWGGPGSGKSHLLTACVKAGGGLYLACGPDLNAAAALDIYEMAGVLALDDVERLDDAGQIALFNLINRRMIANSANAGSMSLVVSCSQPPAATGLRADLATRLAQGLVLEVAALSDGEKAAALTHHARLRGIELPEEVTRYLLSHVARDLPTLIAMLDALDKLSLERQRPITVPLVREVLQTPPAMQQTAN